MTRGLFFSQTSKLLIAAKEELLPTIVGRLQLAEPEAGADPGLYGAVDDVGCDDGGAQALGDLGRLMLRGVGEQDGELVAADAGEEVARAHATLEAGGDGDESGIAAVVAVGIVDALEVVKVDDDGRERGGLAFAGEDALFGGDLDATPV